MSTLKPTATIRIQAEATDEIGPLTPDGRRIPVDAEGGAVFIEPDERPETVRLPAFVLPIADADTPDGYNITATLEAAVSEQGSASSLTFEVDGLSEEQVDKMADSGILQLDAGYADAQGTGSPRPIFFGDIEKTGYTFDAGRSRWRFSSNGKPQDRYSFPVHLAAARGDGVTIGDMLKKASAAAAIPILIPQEAFGDFSRIQVRDGYTEPVDDGRVLANVSAWSPFQFDGPFEQAVDLLVGMLRDAVRIARGVDVGFQYLASQVELQVIVANLDADPAYLPFIAYTLGDPRIITAGLTKSKKSTASVADVVDTAAPATQREYQLVIRFDQRIFIGLIIRIDGSKVGLRSVMFSVRSYKHTLGGKGGWRTEIKGVVVEPNVAQEAIYNQDEVA